MGTRPPTRGAALLDAFLRDNDIADAAAGRATGFSSVAFYYWRTGAKVPDATTRKALALWTAGHVPEDTWLSDDDIAKLASVVPHISDAGHDASEAQPGTDAQDDSGPHAASDCGVNDTGEHPVCSCGQRGAA